MALNFDPATRLAIARLMAGLPSRPGLTKTRVDNLHLTLLFLGDTDEELIPQISQQLAEISQNFSSLRLEFSQLGGFPDLQHPQVIWIGLDSDTLHQLRQAIANRLLPLVPTADTKPFRPHLTIARTNPLFHPETKANWGQRGEPLKATLPPVTIPQIDLMESTLAPGGSIYKKVSSHHLQK